MEATTEVGARTVAVVRTAAVARTVVVVRTAAEVRTVRTAAVKARARARLQQHVEDVGVRLLDLVEQHDGVRVPPHGLRELAARLVPDVAGRRAGEARDGVRLHVLRHVNAHLRAEEIGAKGRWGVRASAQWTNVHNTVDVGGAAATGGARGGRTIAFSAP